MNKVGRDFNQGILQDTYVDDDINVMQHYQQDITKLLEDNKTKRNATSSWKKFDSKQNYHQVLDLSMTDVMKIKQEHGVDLLGPFVDWKYVFKLIETQYPYMKTTTARL
mgnify:CR=1 FL=1|tara:strand:- start:529 stop:855 length:327 start_codon:yes stop_codon:yes gene_type:complete